MDDPEEDNVQNSSLSIPSTSCHQGVVVVFAQPDESSDCECSKEENEKTDNEKMLLQNSSHLRDKDSEEEVSVQFVFDKEDVGKESLSTEPKPKKKLSKKVQKATYLKDDSLSLAICGKNVIPLKLREMVKPRRISSKLKEKWNFMSRVKKQILCPVTSCEKTFSNINGIINHYQWCIGLSGKEFSVCQFCSVPVLTENNSEENHVKSKHPERLHVYKTSRRKGFGKRSTLCSSSEDEINVKKQQQSIKQAQKTLREDNRLNSLVSFSGFEKPRRTYTRENIKPKPIMCNEDSVNSTLNSMLSETNSSSYESTGEDLFVSAFSTPEEYTVQRRKNKENESLPAEMCSSNGSVSSTLSLTETRHQSSPSKLCESGQSTSVENADPTLIDSSEEFDPCASARAESQVKSGHVSVSELDTTYASPPLVQNEDNTDLCNASSSKSSLNLELCNTKTVHEVNAALNENVPGSLLSAFDENDKTSSQNGLSFSESCPVNFTPSRNFNYIERRQLLVTPVLQEEFEPCQKKRKLTHAHDINDPPLNSPNSSIDSEKPNFMHSLELSPSSKLNTDHVIEPEAKSISINLLEASPLADSATEIASFQNNSPNYSAKSQLIKTSPPVTTSSLGKNSPRGKNKSKGVCTSTPTVLFLRPEIDEHEESSPAEEPPSNSDSKAKNFSTAVSEKDEIEFSISRQRINSHDVDLTDHQASRKRNRNIFETLGINTHCNQTPFEKPLNSQWSSVLNGTLSQEKEHEAPPPTEEVPQTCFQMAGGEKHLTELRNLKLKQMSDKSLLNTDNSDVLSDADELGTSLLNDSLYHEVSSLNSDEDFASSSGCNTVHNYSIIGTEHVKNDNLNNNDKQSNMLKLSRKGMLLETISEITRLKGSSGRRKAVHLFRCREGSRMKGSGRDFTKKKLSAKVSKAGEDLTVNSDINCIELSELMIGSAESKRMFTRFRSFRRRGRPCGRKYSRAERLEQSKISSEANFGLENRSGFYHTSNKRGRGRPRKLREAPRSSELLNQEVVVLRDCNSVKPKEIYSSIEQENGMFGKSQTFDNGKGTVLSDDLSVVENHLTNALQMTNTTLVNKNLIRGAESGRRRRGRPRKTVVHFIEKETIVDESEKTAVNFHVSEGSKNCSADTCDFQDAEINDTLSINNISARETIRGKRKRGRPRAAALHTTERESTTGDSERKAVNLEISEESNNYSGDGSFYNAEMSNTFENDNLPVREICIDRRGTGRPKVTSVQATEEPKEKDFFCGSCGAKYLTKQLVLLHINNTHNGLAKVNDNTPLSEKEESLALRIALRRAKKLTCQVPTCRKHFTTIGGYLYHRGICGVEGRGYVSCEICGKKLREVSVVPHMKNAHPVKGSEAMEEKEETVHEEAKIPKRKAAMKAQQQVQSYIKNLAEKVDSNNRTCSVSDSYSGSSSEYDDDDDDDDDEDEKDGCTKRKIQVEDLVPWKGLFCESDMIQKPEEGTDMLQEVEQNSHLICQKNGCGKMFQSIKGLRIHMASCDATLEKTWRCTTCETNFKGIDSLFNHLMCTHYEYITAGYANDSKYSLPKRKLQNVFKEYGTERLDKMPFEPAMNWTLDFRKNHYKKELFTRWKPHAKDWEKLSPSESKQYFPELKESPYIRFDNSDNVPEIVPSAWKKLSLFESISSENASCSTFFVGGPVWACDWCTVPLGVTTKQYIALSVSLKVDGTHSLVDTSPEEGMIQIWDAGILDLNKSERPPQLSLVIAHNFGAVWKLLWCPSGCWEPEYGNQCTKKDMDDKEVLPRLGLMAVACGDGYVRILSIPHPTSLVTDQKGLQAVYKVKPVAVLSPPGEGPCIASKKSICCALGWSRTDGHQLVAGGYASGLLSIWDLLTSSPLLVIESDNRFVKLCPYLSFYAHACCVTSLMWGPVPGGRFLATCSSDRSVKIWDLEDPSIPLSVLKRGLHRDLDWVSHWCGIFVCIDECFNLNKTQTFYKECGYFNYILRVISAHNSTVWKVAVSDWLNVEASCDDAGEVVGTVLCQLMKNVDSLKYICHRRFPIYRIELECLEPRKSDDQPTPASIDNGENSVQEEESVNNTDVKESTTPVNTDISRECLTVNQSLDDQDEAVTTCQMKPKLPDRQKDNSHPKQTEVIEEKSEAPVILSTYKEMSNVYGLVLKDINLENMKDIPQQECKRLIRPESMNVTSLNQYPLTSVNTVVWNPNLKSHLWLLSAGQAGLVRITCLSGLHAPSASTIISKIETENS